MLKLTQISLRRGTKLLFEDVNITIQPGQRVGLTGANGCGKSSLFALLLGQLHADSGEIQLPAGTTIAHLAQETPSLAQAALDYVLDGDPQLQKLQRLLAAAEAAQDGHRQAELHHELDSIDAYTAPTRAAQLLSNLGFKQEQHCWPVANFSGGWRIRLNLAQALMCRSDLLLLDEPTNHLDLDAIVWLEEWLGQYPGTLFVISHDRDFLDQISTHILHIEHHSARLYTGNYSAFENTRSAHLATQQASYEKQRKEIAHVQSFVDRFRAKATKARQAQSRLKALEKMQRIAPAHIDSPFHFSFKQPDKLPNPLLTIEHASIGYTEHPLLTDITVTLHPGQRIGILGLNGSGKSTLIKLLANQLPCMAGQRNLAADLKIGYFAQHQLEQLDLTATPLLLLQRLDKRASEQHLRDYLGGFGFRATQAEQPIAPFSGGEKARMVLALLVFQRPNLLLLDEPTNHLDLEMRHALTLALQAYQGAMIVVSHDRHLLRTVTDELWLVHDGRMQLFDGDVDQFPVWLKAQQCERKLPAPDDNQSESTSDRKTQRRQQAQRRQQLQPLMKQVRAIEHKMDQLTERKKVLEKELCDPSLYQDASKPQLQSYLQEQRDIHTALSAAEIDWLEIHEKIENFTD